MTRVDPGIGTDLAPDGILRAAINLGNPVLAQGTAAAPAGITVDIARVVGTRLDVPVTFVCSGSARMSLAALTSGAADLGFLAIEPARESEVAFTAPYVLIEGVFAVPVQSPFATPADIDRDGVRIGVKQGSAYDLYLTRTLRHATVVRGADGVEAFRAGGLDAVAGIGPPMISYVAANQDLRLIGEPFMQIRQSVGTARAKGEPTLRFLRELVEELKASGFVAGALQRSGQSPALAAGAESPVRETP